MKFWQEHDRDSAGFSVITSGGTWRLSSPALETCALITWLGCCLPGFFPLKLLFLPISEEVFSDYVNIRFLIKLSPSGFSISLWFFPEAVITVMVPKWHLFQPSFLLCHSTMELIFYCKEALICVCSWILILVCELQFIIIYFNAQLSHIWPMGKALCASSHDLSAHRCFRVTLYFPALGSNVSPRSPSSLW